MRRKPKKVGNHWLTRKESRVRQHISYWLFIWVKLYVIQIRINWSYEHQNLFCFLKSFHCSYVLIKRTFIFIEMVVYYTLVYTTLFSTLRYYLKSNIEINDNTCKILINNSIVLHKRSRNGIWLFYFWIYASKTIEICTFYNFLNEIDNILFYW